MWWTIQSLLQAVGDDDEGGEQEEHGAAVGVLSGRAVAVVVIRASL